MKNRFGGVCYRCGKWVHQRAGHFENSAEGSRVHHAECVIMFKGASQNYRNDQVNKVSTEFVTIRGDNK